MEIVRIEVSGRLPKSSFFPTVNVYLLVEGSHGLLIDAGYGLRRALWRILDAVKRHGVHVERLVITHGHVDHFSGARELRRRLGCVVMAHEADEPYIRSPSRLLAEDPFFSGSWWSRGLGYASLKLLAGLAPTPVDETLRDGDRLRLVDGELRVVHTPGHTEGHICLLEEDRGILFTGDHIIEGGVSWILPPRGDAGKYVESLRRIATLPARLILPGHGNPMDKPREVIRDRLSRVAAREEAILNVLETGPMDEEQLLTGLWAGSPLRRMLARPVLRAHLSRLVGDGLVEIRWVGGRRVYRRTG